MSAAEIVEHYPTLTVDDVRAGAAYGARVRQAGDPSAVGDLVKLKLDENMEAEVTAFLGRDRYARGARARAGHRNGYSDVTVKTTAGPVELARPKLRGTDFGSRRGCSART